jgi:hypothetical protein
LLALAGPLPPAVAEAVAVAAVLRARRSGHPVDSAAARWIALRSWRTSPQDRSLVGADELAEALRALPPEVARGIVESQLADEDGWRKALPFLADVLASGELPATIAGLAPRARRDVDEGAVVRLGDAAFVALLPLPDLDERWLGGLLLAVETRARAGVPVEPRASQLLARLRVLPAGDAASFKRLYRPELARLVAALPEEAAREWKAWIHERVEAAAAEPLAVRLRAAAARLGGPTIRIFLLEPGQGEPTGSRVGGDSASGPPGFQHVLTIAASELDGGSLPGGAAAIALFVRDPQRNQAFSPGTDETRVVAVERPDARRARAVQVTAVDVPQVVFDEKDEPTRELRGQLRRAPGYLGGRPLWLQDAEHAGTFVLQARGSLLPMNLGDDGILYVFTDTAFWQAS